MESKVIRKYDKKDLKKLLSDCQEWVNRYVRLRDDKGGYYTCIACGKDKTLNTCNASHFYSQGHHSFLRFHLDNIHAGCLQCNMHLSGNLLNYRMNLLKKIGAERLEWLENNRNNVSNWDRITLIHKIEEFKALVKQLKNAA